MAKFLLKLLYRKVRVPKDRIIALVGKMDADGDGYLSLQETAAVLRAYAVAVKKSEKYLK